MVATTFKVPVGAVAVVAITITTIITVAAADIIMEVGVAAADIMAEVTVEVMEAAVMGD